MTSEVVFKVILKHWKELLMATLLVLVVGKFRYDYKQLERAYETSQQSLEEQIDGLKNIHKRELERREEALNNYRDALAELERNYIESQVELERQQRINRRRLVEDFSGNPEQVISEIKQTYGFRHVD